MIERVRIFDTTLRDGEQSPGASMTLEQKVRVAYALEELGVDVIEAGFPAASQKDFDAVVAITKVVKLPTIAVLARAHMEDIVRANEALAEAEHGRIHTFIGTSPIHLEHKLKMTSDEVLKRITGSVELARKYTSDVEWSAEDATRTEINFLCRCVEAAINAGASIINLPDTVGYMLPDEYGALFRYIREHVPNSHRVTFSAHCHNDLGFAVANSLAAIRAGARQVECTINGIGERAGNAAMEEIVMTLVTRKDVLPFYTAIETKRFLDTSRLVSAVTGFVVQPNKAIVGDNAFAHESGIHQHGVIRHRETYEIMDPNDIGRKESELVLGRHSGRAGIQHVLADAGYRLDNKTFEDVWQRFMKIAMVKKNVLKEELLELVEDRAAAARGPYEIRACNIHLEAHDDSRNAQVTLKLKFDGHDLKPIMIRSQDGEVDAALRAIQSAFEVSAKLTHFHIQALGDGADAVAKAYITLEDEGAVGRATATDTSTIIAATKAYVYALNELSLEKNRGQEERITPPGRLGP